MASKSNRSRLTEKLHNKWRHFERLVAAIHKASDRGSIVKWNEIIDGRQFDVTIRFRKGLYDHLTVVECKDYKQSVSIEKVEAFVTKSREVHASVAVLASTSGFQSGAKEAAKKHGITLLHVTHGTTVDLSVFGLRWSDSVEMLSIKTICLRYADGTATELPDDSNVLTYYSHHTLLECAGTRTPVDSVINANLGALPQDREYRTHTIILPAQTFVVAPDDGVVSLGLLVSIELSTAVVDGKKITGPYAVDPVVLSSSVEVQNVGTNETVSFDLFSLPMGVENTLVPGKFYEAAGLGFFYYCHVVRGELIEMWLVESFQFGHLWQAKLVLQAEAAEKYIEVVDSDVIRRLELRRMKMADQDRQQ